MAIRSSVVAMALCASAAFAQVTMSESSNRDSLTFAFEPDGKLITAVTGRPYSVTETLGNITPNGIRITSSVTRTWRDAQGRKRTEHMETTNPAHPFQKIEIVDPVAGYYYLLDSENHVAHRLAIQTKASQAVRLKPMCPGPASSTYHAKDGEATVTEQIGVKMIEGIEFCGEKRTTTVPAGSVYGNDRPVQVMEESWAANNDGVPVGSLRHADPNGNVVLNELSDVSSSDPDPALFKPPADYHVMEETGKFSVVLPLPHSESRAAEGPRPAAALTGMPFSAELASDRTETTPDGQVLSNPYTTLQYRDGMGRTLHQWRMRDASGAEVLHTTNLIDVVAGYSYDFNSEQMTVRRRALKVTSRSATDAQSPRPSATNTRTLDTGAVDTEESLGAQTIDGFPAYGHRSTISYPPGKISGNDRTFTMVNEFWMSPILGLVVRARNLSPYIGESTTELKSLTLGEPDPALFHIPEGYKIIDDPPAETDHK